MATAEELATRKAALEKALASGARSVTSEGDTVTLRSVAEIRAALAEVNKDIAALNQTKRRRRFYVAGGRGY
ncbi:MAG: hypothetical protein AAFW01_00165 [Pseudomonadota bacterium]